MNSSHKLAAAVALAAGAMLATAGAAEADEASCTALNGATFPASAMSLPSTGAKITAAWTAAAGAAPAYCKVLGEITAVDAKATPILFQVNMPANWNKKAVQFGGGGLNGTLVAATGLVRDAPPGSAPLNRGFVTLGTDGGHPAARPDIGIFHLNEEAYINHAYGANKKAYDLSKVLMQRYYGEAPRLFYFFGGSEGGRQAMGGVQRYPNDYDGVLAIVPAIHNAANNVAKWNAYQQSLDDGWMSKAELTFLENATDAQCDELDGLKDGVISQYTACAAVFDYAKIRCANGADTGDNCLSDKQINAVRTWRSPYSFGFAMKDGLTTLPGYGFGGEGLEGSVNPWIMLDERPNLQSAATEMNASQMIRYAVAQDGNFRGPLDLAKYRQRIQFVSNLMDNNNPDMSAFLASGGKLIMKTNGADYAVSPITLFQYYDKVVATMGRDRVNSFLRFYVNPGVNHGGSGTQDDGSAIPDKVDLFGALDAWVDGGTAPGPLTVTSYTQTTPVASRPLCQYGAYPRYNGSGDTKAAASFTCAPL
jgi:hypothetical protein